VLHDIDLEVPAGASLGLVGRTGSGKTTLARLAVRLYDPDGGRIELGGVDLGETSTADLRRRVRMVTQDVHLFDASVRDNLAFFDGSVDDTAIMRAVSEVGLGDWLEGLPDGLDTRLGQAGVGLSAGEAQLLCFARVFLADAGLVVLDEPSSLLDSATEAIAHAAADRLLTGRTAIVIAHRLSTLTTVDEVAVIDRGRVVEHGPRAALAADGSSRFARLLAATGVPET
jgi:ABC-type multidrug transport system fused ATPase/permease subunit